VFPCFEANLAAGFLATGQRAVAARVGYYLLATNVEPRFIVAVEVEGVVAIGGYVNEARVLAPKIAFALFGREREVGYVARAGGVLAGQTRGIAPVTTRNAVVVLVVETRHRAVGVVGVAGVAATAATSTAYCNTNSGRFVAATRFGSRECKV